MNAIQPTFTMADRLRLEAEFQRKNGTKLGEIIAQEIDSLASIAEQFNARTPDQLKHAMARHRAMKLAPSFN